MEDVWLRVEMGKVKNYIVKKRGVSKMKIRTDMK
jgi:hypothetical protein